MSFNNARRLDEWFVGVGRENPLAVRERMKYGGLFSLLAILLALYAVTAGRWFLLLLWPATSFGVIGAAYFGLGHDVFGKRPDGSMSFASIALLLPYLLYLWGVWHAIRILSREPRYNTLAAGVVIGRRLLSRELPRDIDTVVDLTCEFPEPAALRLVRNYISLPMLDAASLPPESLAQIVRELAGVDGLMFIHCAQGHGRTGLISALLLIARGTAADTDSALKLVQATRPLVGLNRVQRSALHDAAAILQATS